MIEFYGEINKWMLVGIILMACCMLVLQFLQLFYTRRLEAARAKQVARLNALLIVLMKERERKLRHARPQKPRTLVRDDGG